MVLGYFGKTPVPPDSKIVGIAAEQLGLEPTKRSPLELDDDNPEKGVEAARRKLKTENLEETDENIFIAATCQEKGLAFLKGEAELGVRKIGAEDTEPIKKAQPVAEEEEKEQTAAEEKKEETAVVEPSPGEESGQYSVTVNGKEYAVALEKDKATVDGKVYQVGIRHMEAAAEKPAAPASSAPETPRASPPATSQGTPVTAQMPGRVTRILFEAGEQVKAGETILLLEAMKMETPISSPLDGVLSELPVGIGDQVATGDVLAIVT